MFSVMMISVLLMMLLAPFHPDKLELIRVSLEIATFIRLMIFTINNLPERETLKK